MPLYVYGCDKCGSKQELYQPTMEALPPKCCGEDMAKLPTFPSMVKMKGEGGYPSRRKWFHGSAPGATNATHAWSPDHPHGLDQARQD
jgi:predicted nucleic acid-binding Zn ribbon protein